MKMLNSTGSVRGSPLLAADWPAAELHAADHVLSLAIQLVCTPLSDGLACTSSVHRWLWETVLKPFLTA